MYAFGKKIFDKLNDLMNPTFEDEDPVNPFDLWEGANFRLKIRQFEGYPNYDKSEFDAPTPLFDDDDQMEETWKAEHSLQDLVDPKNFKSYSELKTKLYRVLDLASESVEPVAAAPTFASDTTDDLDLSSMSTESAVSEPAMPTADLSSAASDDDDDDLAIFKDLARG
jgi:hypothetical protein